MRVVLSRQLADMPVDRAQWNALLERSPNATVFQTFEWFESWWMAFGQRRQLFLITVWEGDSLVGIAPLMMSRRWGLRQLEFVGSPNADYQDFILGNRTADLLPAIAHYLSEQRGTWDMIVLRNVPTDSPTFDVLPRCTRALRLGTTDHERVACPTLEISSRPIEIQRLLNSYNMRRRIRRLQDLGEVTYLRCTTQSQLDHHLPRFFEQFAHRRRGSAAAAMITRRDVQGFFVNLAGSMLDRGLLHFSVLECANRPASYHFGFDFGGRLYWYKPSFDPNLARQSPGTVLLSYLIRDCLERGLEELDFTVGAEPFKYRYANTQRTNANLRVFSRSSLHLTAIATAATRRKLAQWRRALRV